MPHRKTITSVAISNGDVFSATGALPGRRNPVVCGEVYAWKLKTGRLRARWSQLLDGVQQLEVTPNIVVARTTGCDRDELSALRVESDHQHECVLKLLDAKTGKTLKRLDISGADHRAAFAVAARVERLAVIGDRLEIRDLRKDQRIIARSEIPKASNSVQQLAYVADGSLLVVATNDLSHNVTKIEVRDGRNGRIAVKSTLRGAKINQLAVTSDGRLVIAAIQTTTPNSQAPSRRWIEVRDTTRLKVVTRIDDAIRASAAAEVGVVATLDLNGVVTVWRVSTRNPHGMSRHRPSAR